MSRTLARKAVKKKKRKTTTEEKERRIKGRPDAAIPSRNTMFVHSWEEQNSE